MKRKTIVINCENQNNKQPVVKSSVLNRKLSSGSEAFGMNKRTMVQNAKLGDYLYYGEMSPKIAN